MALQILIFLILSGTAAAVTLSVSRSGGNVTSPYMYGLTLDDVKPLDSLFASSPPYSMRADILEKLRVLNPSFLRLPAGSGARNSSPPSSSTADLIKYMNLATNLSTPVVLPLPLAGNSSPDPVQDSLNELEFLTGNRSTPFGALRASLGYPEPWNIPFVEISEVGSSKVERLLCEKVKESYPTVTTFSSSRTKQNGVGRVVKEYATPDGLVRKFGEFDHIEGLVIVGG